MEIKWEKQDDSLTAFLFGEIDHHNAKAARERLDAMLEKEKPIYFWLDLSKVSFCDSSGLGLVMGRMKKCLALGTGMCVRNPSPAAEKILVIAGMDRILKIERGKQNG